MLVVVDSACQQEPTWVGNDMVEVFAVNWRRGGAGS